MDKVKTFFKQNFIYMIILVVCVIYLLYGLVRLSPSGKTISEILGDTIIAFVFGICIGNLFEMQGLKLGEENEKVLATDERLAEATEGINEDIDMLDTYCVEISDAVLKREQIRYLNELRIKYEDFKEENYDVKKLSWYERMLLFKVKHLRVKPLKASELISEIDGKKDTLNLGKTKKQYIKSTNIKAVISKLSSAIVIGYYSVTLLSNFNWGNLIWTGIQVSIFLLMGTIQMMKSFFFVVDELRNRKIEKINWLLKFKIWVKEKKSKGGEENDRRAEEIGRREEKKYEIISIE